MQRRRTSCRDDTDGLTYGIYRCIRGGIASRDSAKLDEFLYEDDRIKAQCIEKGEQQIAIVRERVAASSLQARAMLTDGAACSKSLGVCGRREFLLGNTSLSVDGHRVLFEPRQPARKRPKGD